MKVEIAGFNIDIKNMNKDSDISEYTPETISAAYARISRSPLSLSELRSNALLDIKSARKSNEQIVYDFNHQSIAEHAVFNIDVEDISRLAAEEIQSHRLISYTERSQRYVKQENSFFLPEEFKNNNNILNLIQKQFNMYYKAYQAIHEELKEQKVLSPRDMEIVAKEDARYLLPLCTYTQFGMTINARNLEYMIRKCYLSKLDEVKEFGKLLLSKTQAIAPSLIRFVDPSEFEKYACDYSNDIIGQTRLIFTTPDAKNLLLDLHKCNFLLDENIVLGKYDRLPREFELIDIIFDVYLSAACFGQLKRHRMTTQLSGKYNPYLGYKIPSSIPESIINEFVSVLSFASQEYNKLKNNVIAQYILPNATYKRMIFKTNLREFYHITKLRMDEHAQWDIRHLITELKRMYLESKDSIDIWNQ